MSDPSLSSVLAQSAESASLDDKYTTLGGRVYLTGTQALVRLPMLQRMRDQEAGLDTAGFVSGYRGSPLGGLDLALGKAREHLAAHAIVFQPGINEDLAATAVWGTQQVGLFPGATHDGVFALWYGKGPGVDRCGDVFRHANAAGSARYGGVLVVAGDDHAAKSSTLPHQTEHVFKAVMMPVLYPANVQEYLDYGLHGWAMSRYSGCWVAFKALADTVEMDGDPHGRRSVARHFSQRRRSPATGDGGWLSRPYPLGLRDSQSRMDRLEGMARHLLGHPARPADAAPQLLHGRDPCRARRPWDRLGLEPPGRGSAAAGPAMPGLPVPHAHAQRLFRRRSQPGEGEGEHIENRLG